MKFAIISDVHANEVALRAVLEDAKQNGVDKFVCLGDVVGYGPLPAETVALVRQTCFLTVAGNHDDAVSGRGDASSFIDLAKEAVDRHRAALSEEDLEWLRSLPYVARIDGAVVVHGDVFDPPKFYYVLDEEGAEANFKKTSARLVFVGHTHEPAIFLTGNSGKVYKTGAQDFTLEDNKRYIVNPGSVGYPRDTGGQCHSSYVLYDSTERTVTFRYLPFLVSSVMQRGEAKRAPGRRRTVALAAAAVALAVALVAALCAWWLTPSTVEVVEDPALVVKTCELTLASDMRNVRANLTLAKESAPLQLRIVFEDPVGEVTGMESLTVKQKSMKGFRIPSGSSRATFTLLKTRREDNAAVVFFAPDATLK